MPTTNSSFAVKPYKNASGTPSWRVSGWLFGARVRKNFATREEAGAERIALEVRAAQANGGFRAAATTLTDPQLRDAEDAFRRIGGRPRSLAFYLEYALLNHREHEREQTIGLAVTSYLATKTKERERGLVSECQLVAIRKELAVLERYFPKDTVSSLCVPGLVGYCERGNASLKTYNNRRGILSTFFKFAAQQDWVSRNPVERVPYHRIAHKRGSARTITSATAQTLMAFVEDFEGGRLVPFFALSLFAGIRPCVRTGEISKLRPEHIRLDTGVIHVEPEVAKTGMKRNVTIQPNLKAWLLAYPVDKVRIVPRNMQHLRATIAKRFDLSHDVMRHTFISMFVAKFRSMGEAALQAGNSESIIRKHYLDLKSPEEAEKFFGIVPRAVAAAEKKNDVVSLASFAAGMQPISACGG